VHAHGLRAYCNKYTLRTAHTDKSGNAAVAAATTATHYYYYNHYSAAAAPRIVEIVTKTDSSCVSRTALTGSAFEASTLAGSVLPTALDVTGTDSLPNSIIEELMRSTATAAAAGGSSSSRLAAADANMVTSGHSDAASAAALAAAAAAVAKTTSTGTTLCCCAFHLACATANE
jgi:hypothetical protein